MSPNDPLADLNAYWVILERFLAGAYPGSLFQPESFAVNLRTLDGLGITHYVDLTGADECPQSPYPALLFDETVFGGQRFAYQRQSIPDMGVPSLADMRNILDSLDKILDSGGKLYLHCLGGRGRTGLVVGCYLVRHGMNGSDALAVIEQKRRRLPNARYPSPETFEQRTFVLNWGFIEQP